jgi:hypothetical protein
MDAVESFVSPNTRKDHIAHSFVNPSVDKYAVNAAALKFMASGSIITYHWQLNPFITTCDFSRVCLLLCVSNEWQVCHERVLLVSCGKCGLTFSLL